MTDKKDNCSCDKSKSGCCGSNTQKPKKQDSCDKQGCCKDKKKKDDKSK